MLRTKQLLGLLLCHVDLLDLGVCVRPERRGILSIVPELDRLVKSTFLSEKQTLDKIVNV